MKKIVVARLDIKPEAVDQFTKSAQKVIEETRKENGCVTYILYKSCVDPENEFFFYEVYKDQQALDLHNNSTYLNEFLTTITPLLSGSPIIEVY